MNPDFYKRAFWALVVFCLGNGTGFLAFGLNRASATDVDKATTSITTRLDSQDAHLQSIDTKFANLSGQLLAKKVIATVP